MKWKNKSVFVKESKRKKTMDIVIERNGSLCVLVPEHFAKEQIIEILDKKEYDITKKLIQWEETHKNKIVRRYMAGQSFMYLGRNYCLNFVENAKTSLSLQNGKFLMDSEVTDPRQIFINVYKKQAQIIVQKRFDKFSKLLNIQAHDMQIRDIRSRWGSCTPNKRIFYHWKVAMLPPKIVDYIILHELMHVKYPRHTCQFWNEIANILPDYTNSVTWLREKGICVEL